MIKQTKDGVVLLVHVQPNAKRNCYTQGRNLKGKRTADQRSNHRGGKEKAEDLVFKP